jgi:hypothetical protein
MRATSECLAPPQVVVADNYTSTAHNGISRQSEALMTTIQSPSRAISHPHPWPVFPVYSPKNPPDPHPPYPVEAISDQETLVTNT